MTTKRIKNRENRTTGYINHQSHGRFDNTKKQDVKSVGNGKQPKDETPPASYQSNRLPEGIYRAEKLDPSFRD